MRRVLTILAATALFMALAVPVASGAIHPIVCSSNAGVPNGLVDNPARGSGISSELGNPPGITPDGVEAPPGNPHFDDLMAGDDNPTGRNAFAPLAAQGFDDTRPNWDKDCGQTP
jgi:hypothetical protein